MPRREDEPQPLYYEGKMSDETRRMVFRKNEEELEDAEASEPVAELQYSGASETSAKSFQRGSDGTHRHSHRPRG